MSRGPGLSVDAQIRYELSRVDHPPGRGSDEVTESDEAAEPSAQPRLVHALRAVLDECGVLDKCGVLDADPDTVQLAEDIRTVIATVLRLDD